MTIAGAMQLDLVLKGSGNINAMLKQTTKGMKKAEQGMNGVKDSAKGLNSKLTSLAKSWGALAVGAGAAVAAAKGLALLGESGSMLQAQLSGLGDTAGSAFKKMEKVAASAKGLYSVEDLIKVSARSKELGINLALSGDQLVKLDARFTRLGFSGGDALQMLVESLATGRRGFLKKLGFVHDAHSAHEKYAKFIGLANAAELSAGQKILALQHSVIESIKNISTEGGSTIDQTEQAAASWANLMMHIKLMLAPMSAATEPLARGLAELAKIIKVLFGPILSIVFRTIGAGLTMFSDLVALLYRVAETISKEVVTELIKLAKWLGMDGVAGDLQFLTAEADDTTVALKDMDETVKGATISMGWFVKATAKGVIVLSGMQQALRVQGAAEKRLLKESINLTKSVIKAGGAAGERAKESIKWLKVDLVKLAIQKALRVEYGKLAKGIVKLRATEGLSWKERDEGEKKLKATSSMVRNMIQGKLKHEEIAIFTDKKEKKRAKGRTKREKKQIDLFNEINALILRNIELRRNMTVMESDFANAQNEWYQITKKAADASRELTAAHTEETRAMIAKDRAGELKAGAFLLWKERADEELRLMREKIELQKILEERALRQSKADAKLNAEVSSAAGVMGEMSAVTGGLDAKWGNLQGTLGGMTDLFATADARGKDLKSTIFSSAKMAGPAAMQFIDGKKEQAQFMGAFEAAMAVASMFINPAEAGSHAIASAMFFALAGGAIGNLGASEAGAAPATDRGSSKGGLTSSGDGGRTVVVNFGSGIVLGDKAQIAKAIQEVNHSVISTGDKWAT